MCAEVVTRHYVLKVHYCLIGLHRVVTLLKKKQFLLPHQRTLIFLDSQHLLTLVCASAVAEGRLCQSSYEFTASNLQRIIIIIIGDVYFVIETMRVWVSSCKHYYYYYYYHHYYYYWDIIIIRVEKNALVGLHESSIMSSKFEVNAILTVYLVLSLL